MKKFLQIVASLELWLVGGTIAASVVSEAFLLPALYVALSFWAIRWLAYGRPTQRTPADGGIIMLMLLIPVTLWATAFPDITIPQVYRLLTGIALYYTIVNWAHTRNRLQLIIVGTVTAGLVLALFAAISVQWIPSKLTFLPASLYSVMPREVTDVVNPNVMAGQLALLLPIALALIVFHARPMHILTRLFVWGSTFVMGGMLLLTQSRGALLATALSFGVLVVLRLRIRWLLLGVSIGSAIFLALLPSAIWHTLIDKITTDEAGRVELWTRAWYMVQDFAFTGIGMGSYHEVASLLYPFFVIPAGRGEHAHNLLLQVWVDLGTFGVVAWVSILLMTLRAAWHMYTSTHTVSWIPALGAGVLCSNVALLIHGMVDAVTWGMIRPAPLVWLVWGIAMAGVALVNASPHPSSHPVQTPTETTTTNTQNTVEHIIPS